MAEFGSYHLNHPCEGCGHPFIAHTGLGIGLQCEDVDFSNPNGYCRCGSFFPADISKDPLSQLALEAPSPVDRFIEAIMEGDDQYTALEKAYPNG